MQTEEEKKRKEKQSMILYTISFTIIFTLMTCTVISIVTTKGK